MKTKTLVLKGALLTAAFPLAVVAAYTVGAAAYTKRLETALLAEPKPMAEPMGRVPYATRLNVEEVRGRWLKVSDGKTSGWVFAGNLAEQMPEENKGLDGLPIAASETTVTAAARPLAPAAADYGTRRGLETAAADAQWLNEMSAAVVASEVDAYLQEQKKGEHQ